MKALTIWQPWASLLAMGLKKYETRSWKTNHRGPMAIHAAKKPIKEVEKFLLPEAYIEIMKLLENKPLKDMPTSCIVGIGKLAECHLIDEEFIKKLSPIEKLLGDYTPGRYAWEFKEMKPLSLPLAAKGSQGIWNW